MGGGLVPTSRMYTPEAFTDAIVEWIIADDHVSICYSVRFFTDAFYHQ